uniref:Persulfide dioxygenase ETHE1, mitochondrial n=1 Tax=Ascaris suum TaxID=6253 RepID=F1LD67_ASCSU
MANKLIFRQLFEMKSCTYTFLLACPTTRKAIIIDPVIETVERDSNLIRQLELDLIYGANTHVHADHVTGTGELKRIFPRMKSVLSKYSGGRADVLLDDGDVLKFGNESLEARTTPGHTDGCLTYISHAHRMAFTGDTLLIRGCGRTDFQQGDSKMLYKMIHEKILSLPDDFAIYPGHDYKGLTQSSVAEEKKFNPRLTKNLDEFIEVMKNLKLSYPAQIDKSVPANKVCGVYELMDEETKAKVRPKRA